VGIVLIGDLLGSSSLTLMMHYLFTMSIVSFTSIYTIFKEDIVDINHSNV